MLLSRFLGTLSIFSILPCISLVSAQDYPNKPIRVVVAPAGGGADFTARLVANGISAGLGQPLVVENKGSGILAAEVVANAKPDGYTFFIGGDSTWILQLLQKVPFDAQVDFAAISLIERSPNVIAVNPSVPAKSVQELIALAKANPGKLNYSSASPGTPAHLMAELFKSMTGVNIVWVPYKGSAPAITAIVGGEVQVTFGAIAAITPHVKTGALRALAVTSAKPSALFPGLPPLSASVPGYEATGMTAALAPAKTPAVAINRLNQEIVRFLNRPEVKERFLNAGIETFGTSSAELTAIIKNNMSSMGQVIKNANIKLD